MGINIKTKNVVILTSYNWALTSKYKKVHNIDYSRGRIVNILLRSDFYEEENLFGNKVYSGSNGNGIYKNGEEEIKEESQMFGKNGVKNKIEKTEVLLKVLTKMVEEREKYKGYNIIMGNLEIDKFYYISNYYYK